MWSSIWILEITRSKLGGTNEQKTSMEEAREREDKEEQKIVKIQGDNPQDDDKQIGKWSLREK